MKKKLVIFLAISIVFICRQNSNAFSENRTGHEVYEEQTILFNFTGQKISSDTSLIILSPLDGELFHEGDSMNIIWESENINKVSINIYFTGEYDYNDKIYNPFYRNIVYKIADSINADEINFVWRIPHFTHSLRKGEIFLKDIENGKEYYGGAISISIKPSWAVINDSVGHAADYQIHFADSLNGIIFGNDIGYKTNDGGYTWIQDENQKIVQKSYFLDRLSGWAISDSSELLKTEDGGKTWIEIDSNNKFLNISSLFFLDATNGYMTSSDGICFYSFDGGINWEQNNLRKIYPDCIINDIFFKTPDTGWIVGVTNIEHLDDYHLTVSSSLTLKTLNGGSTWERKNRDSAWYSLSYTSNDKIFFLDENNGYLSSWYQGFDLPKVFETRYTEDGGLNWNLIFNQSFLFNDNSIINNKNFWLAGVMSDGNKQAFFQEVYPAICHTSNGGETWINDAEFEGFQKMSIEVVGGILHYIASIDFVNEKLGWALLISGDSRPDKRMLVLKYEKKDSVLVSLENSRNESILNDFSLSQNYPNPFNPSTKIKFGLPKESKTSLVIYNLLGQEVTKLVNKQLKAGYHEVEFNNSNYSSGIYFYRIQAGDFVETKKMILLK